MPPKKKQIVMSGVTKPASNGDVISPSMAARLSRLDAAASWTEEPAKRVPASVTEPQSDVIADLAKVVAKANSESREAAQLDGGAEKQPQDAKNDDTHADALAGVEKTHQEPLAASEPLNEAQAEPVSSVKPDPSDVEIAQISVGQEAFGPSSHVIDSMQVAALRIGGSSIDRSEEDAATLTPPPAPATATPVQAAAPAEAKHDPLADLMRTLSPDVLAQLALLATVKVPAVEQQPESAAAAVSEEAEDDDSHTAASQSPAKAVRRRKRALPWEDQSSSGLKKRFTMEVPIELHNRLEFLAGTTFGSNMTYLALEALAPVLDAELRDRGYDPQPLDLSRLLNKRGKNFNG